MFYFSKRSLDKRQELHPKLQRIVDYVLRVFDISLACGHRSEADQNKVYGKGTSQLKWPESKHNSKPSRAVDAWPYPVQWPNLKRIPGEYHEDVRDYARSVGTWYYMGGLFKGVAVALGIKLRWGGHFKSIFDGPHIELDDDE